MLPESNTWIQAPVRSADGMVMKKSQQHWDLVAGLQSLDQVERGLRSIPASERHVAMELTVRLRNLMSARIERSTSEFEGEVGAATVQEGFVEQVKAGLGRMARDARLRGIHIAFHGAPSVRAIPFATGGPILLGLVQQALSARVFAGSERNISVTAAIDAQQRLVISIEDSARAGRECYSIRDLGQWRRRIGDLGGELRLRGVPFGSGTTIQATLPVVNEAA